MTTSSSRTGVCAPQGFSAAGAACGIKKNGRKDVAVIFSEQPASAAGVFTTNLACSSAVIVSREHIKSGACRAVVMSSGNANAATGAYGIETVRQMCEAAAQELGVKTEEVLASQTGLIGIPLDRETAVSGARKTAALVSTDGGQSAAEAIMTTDTVPKSAEETIELQGKTVTVGGIAKGAAMLSPAMATMLVTVTTDASVAPAVLSEALKAAMESSFHSIVVDACRSTNDTVIVLANGAAGGPDITEAAGPDYAAFAEALRRVCDSLAVQMVRDAEGASKLMKFTVRGARNAAEARLAGRGVVSSMLVKCSLYGKDPYWGRILSELGASGAVFDPRRVSITYGSITNCRNGEACDHDAAALKRYMDEREIQVTADLGAGSAQAVFYGCDLTHAYVDENSGTS